MTKKAKTILEKAMMLDDAERAQIAGRLLASLEPPGDDDVEAAWKEEVRQPLAAMDQGDVELVPWEQVRDRLFARLRDA